MLDAGTAEFGVGAQLGEHGLHLGFAEAEVAQGGEDLGVCVDALRDERVAVGSAIGVPEAERTIALDVNEQLAAMGGSMVRRAQDQEVRRFIATAFCAWPHVVHVDEGRVGASRHRAAASIAREHGASQRRRDALSGAARTDVGGSLRRGRVGRDGGGLSPALRVHVGVV